MNSRWRFGPVAASILAGFIGGGVLDGLATVARASGPSSPLAVLGLSVGLYGAVGLVAAVLLGFLVGGVLRAIPGGPAGLVGPHPDNQRRDWQLASALLAGAVAALVFAVAAALGHRVVVRPMQSDTLATIATAGLALLLTPFAVALAIALGAPIGRWVTPRLPRPARTGITGLLLALGAAGGLVAAVGAFSRADWRVLDLSPFVGLGLVAVAGVAHGLFWYRSAAGRRLAPRVPATALSVAAVLVVVGGLVAGRGLAATSPALKAADEGSLGLRVGLRIARAVTDGDKDGFSARFGGGDCDDHNPAVYPGAEDEPGNGIDENCEGGDAQPVAEETPTEGGQGAANAPAEAPTKAPPDGARKASAVATDGAAATGDRFAGNVLIITIDALRGDRLGVAGYGRPGGKSLTPNLDALAKRGAYFKRAWSQAPNTPRSFPSILTSSYPSGVRWDKPGVNYPVVLPANHTFFEDLQAAGLTPIGIFSHFYFTPDRGISKAFKEWSNDGAGTIAESNKDSASPRIVPRVIARLKKAAASHERFVLWTHLFEPHSSYMPHKEFPSSGQGGVPGLLEKYDHEIAYVDMWVGRLLKGLDDMGLGKTTAVVIMADHGEAWQEHKAMFHGTDLFEEQLRIPLIIAIPGRKPSVHDDAVAAVDLGPTLVELVGAAPAKSFRGRSLLPLIDGGELPARPVYGELMPATAWPHQAAMMVDGGKKIIHRISDRRWELYDLAKDPGEKRNLAEDAGSRAAFEKMKAALLSFEERKR